MPELEILRDGVPIYRDHVTQEEMEGWNRYMDHHESGPIPSDALARVYFAHFRRGIDLTRTPGFATAKRP
jgi:hypothetical protein